MNSKSVESSKGRLRCSRERVRCDEDSQAWNRKTQSEEQGQGELRAVTTLGCCGREAIGVVVGRE